MLADRIDGERSDQIHHRFRTRRRCDCKSFRSSAMHRRRQRRVKKGTHSAAGVTRELEAMPTGARGARCYRRRHDRSVLQA